MLKLATISRIFWYRFMPRCPFLSLLPAASARDFSAKLDFAVAVAAQRQRVALRLRLLRRLEQADSQAAVGGHRRPQNVAQHRRIHRSAVIAHRKLDRVVHIEARRDREPGDGPTVSASRWRADCRRRCRTSPSESAGRDRVRRERMRFRHAGSCAGWSATTPTPGRIARCRSAGVSACRWSAPDVSKSAATAAAPARSTPANRCYRRGRVGRTQRIQRLQDVLYVVRKPRSGLMHGLHVALLLELLLANFRDVELAQQTVSIRLKCHTRVGLRRNPVYSVIDSCGS